MYKSIIEKYLTDRLKEVEGYFHNMDDDADDWDYGRVQGACDELERLLRVISRESEEM